MSGARIEAVEPVYEGWGRILKITIAGRDGARFSREVEDHGDAAAVLPYDPKRRTALLVSQLRAPMLLVAGQAEGLEAIAGLLDGDEPIACARREAEEEAGVVLERLEPVGLVWMSPGVSTERIHLFLGPYETKDRSGPGGGLASEHENITVVEAPLSELVRMSEDGRLADAKTLIMLQALRLRRPELFAP